MLPHRHKGLAQVVMRENEQLDVAALLRDVERLTADAFRRLVVAEHAQGVAPGRDDEPLTAPIAEFLGQFSRGVEMLEAALALPESALDAAEGQEHVNHCRLCPGG